MRIVGGEKNFVVADALDHVGEGFLLRFRREEPVAMFDILAGFLLAKRCFNLSPLLPLLIHPLDPIGNPTDTAFKKCDTQLRKLLRDPAVHQSGELNEGLHRPADRMHEYETVETFFSGRSFAPVMHAKRNVKALELLVDRPEHLRPQMFLHSLGSDGDGREAEFSDCAVGFLNRRCGVLEGQQGDSLEPWRLAAYLGDKVVVSARISNRVVALDKTINGKAAGGKEDRNVDPFSVHVFEPGRNVNVLHASDKPAHTRIHSIGR